MSRRSEDPFVTDDEIEDMRLGSGTDLAAMQEICERSREEARRRKQYKREVQPCCADGWITVDKGPFTYAEPCPTHKPNWVHPEERRERSKDDQRERNIARAKEKFGL